MSDILSVKPHSHYLKNHITAGKGVISLVKSINQEAQQFTDRDLLNELAHVTQQSSSQVEDLPSVEFLNGLEAHLKLINSHVVPVTRIGQQYVKLRRNQLKLDQTQQKLDNINNDITDVQNQDQNCIKTANHQPMAVSVADYQNFPMGNSIAQDINGTSYKIVPFQMST